MHNMQPAFLSFVKHWPDNGRNDRNWYPLMQ